MLSKNIQLEQSNILLYNFISQEVLLIIKIYVHLEHNFYNNNYF
jgi:hypothetical protein